MPQEKNHSTFSVQLKVRFFDFVTPSMIITVAALAFLIIYQKHRIAESYHENIPLNSMIFLVCGYSIFKCFWNNIQLFGAMKYLKEIEDAEASGNVTRAQVQVFADDLETRGFFMHIQNMYNALENLITFGHLNFTHDDSRLIKSKFGNRVKTERLVVNYFAGLLIMLGLIGTFWGLLQTITAVGEVLGEVSNNMSAQSGDAAAAAGGGGVDLGSFITKIAAPLQGMGIAFSASLFGIGGSLILGFLNFFATHAQDDAIELFGRWLDSRIPQMSPGLNTKANAKKLPQANDLKAWLAGFVYLSTKTNHKMGQMMLALIKSTQAMQANSQHIEKLAAQQKNSSEAMDNMGHYLGQMTHSLNDIKNVLIATHEQVAAHAAVPAPSYTGEGVAPLVQQMGEFTDKFERFNQTQNRLVGEIEKLHQAAPQDNAADFSNLVWQLNTILEEIKQKNDAAYFDVFEEPEEAQ